MSNYIFDILSFNCENVDSNADVIRQIVFRVYGSDTNGKIAEIHMTIGLPLPTEAFIPYSDLSEDKAIEWIKSTLGNQKVQEIYDTLDAQFGIEKTTSVKRSVPAWKVLSEPTLTAT
jgi:hypothetical protein